MPIKEILKCRNIGISSGASAPEVLVMEFIDKVKERANIEINEIEVAKEDIVFKIPNKLT
jgi:4-hydroxy-3-methylbut-2-enyl diphosphate reductase